MPLSSQQDNCVMFMANTTDTVKRWRSAHFCLSLSPGKEPSKGQQDKQKKKWKNTLIHIQNTAGWDVFEPAVAHKRIHLLPAQANPHSGD